MERFEWSEKYCTNIDQIDRQHRDLLYEIDRFGIAILNGESRQSLEKMLIFLEEYVENHFLLEEKLMRESKYDDQFRHIKNHNTFRALFSEFVDEFNKRGGDSYLALRLEREIRKWWIDHILDEDMKYVPYLKVK